MQISKEPQYTFDDVLLVPQMSLSSRNDADTSTSLAGIPMAIPIVSSNMDSITEEKMAHRMRSLGGLGILHRYASKEKVVQWIKYLLFRNIDPIPSIGVSEEDFITAGDVYYPAIIQNPDNVINSRHICVDVANAHSLAAINQVKRLKLLGYKVIVGNVATYTGAWALAEAGADVIKVGIGPGSVCTTRVVTGHGVPQLSAIMEVVKGLRWFPKVQIIADGGIRNSGDMVKALAAGAHAVMIGGLLAGTDENPPGSVYRGMASEEARAAFVNAGGKLGAGVPEGIQKRVSPQGPVSAVIEKLVGGLRSGMSYSNARTLYELRENAEFVVVTPNTVIENGPHGLKVG